MNRLIKLLKDNVINIIIIAVCVPLIIFTINQAKLAIGFLARTPFKFAIPFINIEMQNDTFFTIASGKNILENGINNQEVLTWHEGLKFNNPRWLFDVFIAILYGKIGFFGIYIYVIIMSLILLGLIFFVSYKQTKNWKLTLIYIFIITCICKRSFTARAWQFSFIFMVLQYFFIQKLLDTGKIRYSVYIILIGILIANIHASIFPIYLVIFVPYLLEFLLKKLQKKYKKFNFSKIEVEERGHCKKFIITFIIACFSGLINPFGLLPYTYMLRNMSGYSVAVIGELKFALPYNCPEFYILILTTLIFALIGKQKVRLTDLCFILGFSFLTICAYRTLYYVGFIAIFGIIRIANDFFKENNYRINKYLKIFVIILLSIIFVSFGIIDLVRSMRSDLVPEREYPIKLADYMLKEMDLENVRLWNSFNWGSYLEFRGIKTFIDSRSEVFCEEFNKDCTVLKDWDFAVNKKASVEEIFEKYDINYVAIKNMSEDSILVSGKDEFVLVYSDDNFSLYKVK